MSTIYFTANLKDTTSTLSITANGTAMSVADYSNYGTSTEPGHLQINFNAFRVIKFTLPDGSTYTMSSINTGDQSIYPPYYNSQALTLPITDIWQNYTSGDGVYSVSLYTVPTWNASVNYQVSLNHCVYYGGKLYQALTNNTGSNPYTHPAVWEVITSYDSLPSKYTYTQKYAVVCDTKLCFISKMVAALCLSSEVGCNYEKLYLNRDYMIANKIHLILAEVDYLVEIQDWTSVKNALSYAKSVCCCSSKQFRLTYSRG